MILLLSPIASANHWNVCKSIAEQVAQADIADATGEVTHTYICETRQVIIISRISYEIKVDAVKLKAPKLVENYCLLMSKNYVLADDITKEWMAMILSGGFKYVVQHHFMNDIVIDKTFDECLNLVDTIEDSAPENQYEKTKYVHKYTPKD